MSDANGLQVRCSVVLVAIMRIPPGSLHCPVLRENYVRYWETSLLAKGDGVDIAKMDFLKRRTGVAAIVGAGRGHRAGIESAHATKNDAGSVQLQTVRACTERFSVSIRFKRSRAGCSLWQSPDPETASSYWHAKVDERRRLTGLAHHPRRAGQTNNPCYAPF